MIIDNDNMLEVFQAVKKCLDHKVCMAIRVVYKNDFNQAHRILCANPAWTTIVAGDTTIAGEKQIIDIQPLTMVNNSIVANADAAIKMGDEINIVSGCIYIKRRGRIITWNVNDNYHY